MQLRVSLSYSEVHFEDIGRTVHIYISLANKMSRPNKQQMHLPMSIYYPPYYKSQPILFCVRNKYSKQSGKVVGCDRSQITTTISIKKICLCNVADATEHVA